MRAFFTCILLSIVLFASSERKIIVGSFATEKGAQRALKIFQSKLSEDFLAAQQRLGFAVVARPSGRQYIIALEPFPSYTEAKNVKKMLPKMYASAFINKYTPPVVPPSSVESSPEHQHQAVMVAKPKEDANTTAVTEENIHEVVVAKTTKKEERLPSVDESNTTHEHDANVTIKPANEEVRLPSASKETSFIIDAVTMKLIDAKKAFYAVEGQTYGIMSPSGKFAFAEKAVAEEFVKQYGGRVVDYATMLQLEQKESKQ